MSFAYDAPKDNNGVVLIDNIEGFADFMAMLSADYAIESVGTSFNMNTLKLKVDEDTWLNVSFNK